MALLQSRRLRIEILHSFIPMRIRQCDDMSFVASDFNINRGCYAKIKAKKVSFKCIQKTNR